MKILSLFDGISALQQAFKNLGIEFDGKDNVYFSSEIDKYAIQITQKNFPNTKQLGDIKELFTTDEGFENVKKNESLYKSVLNQLPEWRHKETLELEKNNIDLLSFGFPCQDISIAKQDRKGLAGDRSGLFYEALRILKEVKPKFFLAENVASMSKEVKEEITKELFGIEPVLLNSALLTAQTRKRLFWIGKLQENRTYKKIEISEPEDKGILLKDILESGNTYQGKSYALTASYNGAIFWNTLEKKQRTMILEPIRLGHFNKGGQGDRIYSVEGKSICLSANGGGRGGKTGIYKIDLPDGEYSVRKLTVNECCRLQGFPDNFCDNVSATQGYKALGNSFTIPIIEHILKVIYEK